MDLYYLQLGDRCICFGEIKQTAAEFEKAMDFSERHGSTNGNYNAFYISELEFIACQPWIDGFRYDERILTVSTIPVDRNGSTW